MFNVDVIDATGEAPAGVANQLPAVLRRASRDLPLRVPPRHHVTIRLTRRDEISALHEAYFGNPEPTDVISFPSGDDPSTTEYLGDIAICVDVAADQAREAGHSTNREIVFLALHGLLHLLGWRDEDDEQRREMLDLQERLLRQYEAEIGRRL